MKHPSLPQMMKAEILIALGTVVILPTWLDFISLARISSVFVEGTSPGKQ
jgi:hypothetical protein